MPRMSADERRELLIEAAIAVMERDGVPHTTTRAIVAEAHMPIGVFHYCFRSKDELVLEVMRTISARSFAAVAEVLDAPASPARLIALATEAYWGHIESNPLEHLLTYELTQYALRSAPDAAVGQYDAYHAGMQLFLGALAERAGLTWQVPVAVVGRVVLAHVEGITFQWLVDRDSAAARAVLAELVRYLELVAGLAMPQTESSSRAVG